MIIGLVHDRAQPVEKVQHLRARHPREKIFVSAGKTDDFVRENRSDDDDLIVIENAAG